MLYNRCTGIYKFRNNTYPRRIRRRSNLGHIFLGKSASYGPRNEVHTYILHTYIDTHTHTHTRVCAPTLFCSIATSRYQEHTETVSYEHSGAMVKCNRQGKPTYSVRSLFQLETVHFKCHMECAGIESGLQCPFMCLMHERTLPPLART